jgi:hypothetical protein
MGTPNVKVRGSFDYNLVFPEDVGIGNPTYHTNTPYADKGLLVRVSPLAGCLCF